MFPFCVGSGFHIPKLEETGSRQDGWRGIEAALCAELRTSKERRSVRPDLRLSALICGVLVLAANREL
jgi:hypothetical protein